MSKYNLEIESTALGEVQVYRYQLPDQGRKMFCQMDLEAGFIGRVNSLSSISGRDVCQVILYRPSIRQKEDRDYFWAVMERIKEWREKPNGNYMDYVLEGATFPIKTGKVHITPSDSKLVWACLKTPDFPYDRKAVVDPHFVWNQILDNHNGIDESDKEFDLSRYKELKREHDILLKALPALAQWAEVLPGFTIARETSSVQAFEWLHDLTNGISGGTKIKTPAQPLSDPWDVEIPVIENSRRTL